MDATGGRAVRSFPMFALATALALGAAARAHAADDIDTALSSAGKVWYERYCTQCHGPGGAPGTAVYSATKAPVDLREYVKRHGGKFPAADWLAVISDSRRCSVHTAVWEGIKREQSGVAQEPAARGVVGSIARYIRSIQRK